MKAIQIERTGGGPEVLGSLDRPGTAEKGLYVIYALIPTIS